MKLSVVSPVFNSSETIEELVHSIFENVAKVADSVEIILVDDCSSDQTWSKINDLSQRYPDLKGIRLSHNVGQDRAITAGLHHVTGDAAIVMDCDLQDDPTFIPDIVDKHREGYDIVFTVKKVRSHPFLKNLFGTLYHKIANLLITVPTLETDPRIGAYSLLSRDVVEAFKQINDFRRRYLMLVKMLGYERGYVSIEHKPRPAGKSTYTFPNLFYLAIDSLVIYSNRLLKLCIVISVIEFICSLFIIAFLVVTYLLFGYKSGWVSTMCVLILSTSLIQLSLSVIGLYIDRIFEQVRDRPLYIVREKRNI